MLRTITLLSLLIPFLATAQVTFPATPASEYRYLIPLTDSEVMPLLDKGLMEIPLEELAAPTDSVAFPESFDADELPVGNYLEVWAQDNQEVRRMLSRYRLRAFVVNNHVDLAVVVLDSLGQTVTDAVVEVKGKPLELDVETSSYRHPKSRREGVLTVSRNGHTDYFSIDASKGNTPKEVFRRIVYTPPIRWIWRIPFRLVADPVRSLRYRHPYGWVYAVTKPFMWGNLQTRTKGYVAINQPKYRPGDTVRIKALLLNRNGKAIDRPVLLYAEQGYNHRKLIDTLQPYRPGAYEYEFVIHDSLDFKLDQYVNLSLRKEATKIYATTSFQLEDYELKEVKGSLTSDGSDIYRGEPFSVTAHMTDQNGLNVPGARIELVLTPSNVRDIFADQVFVPDTLWTFDQVLDPIGATEIVIPDSAFPKADLYTSLQARLISVEGEVVTRNLQPTFHHQACRLSLSQKQDTLLATVIGCPDTVMTATLQGLESGRMVLDQTISLPANLIINPAVERYTLTSGMLSAQLNPKLSDVRILIRRTEDSLVAWLHNPEQREVWVEVFRGQRSIFRVQGSEWEWAVSARTKDDYFFSVNTLWAGQLTKAEFASHWDPDKLELTTDIPDKIFPGEEVTVNLSLQRQDGTPAADADLTAYALTSAFPNIRYPNAPFGSVPLPSRKGRNTFNRKLMPASTEQEQLDYFLWAERFGIDSLTAYQFLYPEGGRQRFEVEAEDGETQMAVFVVQEGKIQPIRYVVQDAFPIFANGLHGNRPYSFPAYKGYHTLEIRTAEHLIRLDSVWIADSMKTLISVDLDQWSPNTRIEERKNKVTDYERELIRPHVLSYVSAYQPYGYFKQGRTIVPLNPPQRYYGIGNRNLYGPFRQSSLTFSVPGNYSLTQPFEPGYQYQFSDSLWKMKSQELMKWELDGALGTNGFQQTYGKVPDEVLREEELMKRWKFASIQSSLYSWTYQIQNHLMQGGEGQIVLDIQSSIEPLLLLLTSIDNPLIFRLFPGSFNSISNLPEGTYNVQMWGFEGQTMTIDSIKVKKNGTTHISKSLDPESSENPSAWQNSRDALLEFRVSVTDFFSGYDPVLQFLREFGCKVGNTFPAIQNENTILIQVLDSQSMEPIRYANVEIPGSRIHSMTDKNGQLMIVPDSGMVLRISKFLYHPVKLSLPSRQKEVTILLGVDKSAAQNLYLSIDVAESRQYLPVSNQEYEDPEGISFRSVLGSHNGFYVDGRLIRKGTAHHGELTAIQDASYNEVVVVGYSIRSQKAGISIPPAPAFGSGDSDSIPDTYDQEPVPATTPLSALPSNLRSNFRDYAYWQPSLRTNAEGKVSYTVTFPDDITKWDHRVLAYDFDRRRGADLQSFSLSYLPLMARLSVPRFLVEGDSSLAFGKVQNVTEDSLTIQLQFSAEGAAAETASLRVGPAALDTLAFVAPSGQDSMSVLFRLEEAESGFFDGEERDIPIFRRGDRTTVGQFWMLLGDTTVTPTFDNDDSVNVSIHASMLDVLLEEIEHLRTYPYLCNEQAASKLKALLLEKKVRDLMGEEFRHEFQVNSLIRKLQKSQNEEQLWGWWEGNETLPWISVHVLEALLQAEEAGYPISIDKELIKRTLQNHLTREKQYQRIDILFLLHQLGSDINFQEFIEAQEADTTLYLTNRFKLIRLRQLRGLDYDLDTLWTYQLESVRGQLYWPGSQYSLLYSNLEATLLAYRILRDVGGHEQKLQRIQGWLLAQRQTRGCWINTYASSRILETILPDLLVAGTIPEKPVVRVRGSESRTIEAFPFQEKMAMSDVQSVVKTGPLPAYLSVSQTFFEQEPVANDSLFSVRTGWLSNQGDTLLRRLEAGQSATLWVEVSCAKSSEYIQLEVPIPGGCSYAEQGRGYGYREVHREQRRDRVAIFCQELPAGTHRFEVKLQARFPGVYTLNPARVEEMYFPVFFGRNGMETVVVE